MKLIKVIVCRSTVDDIANAARTGEIGGARAFVLSVERSLIIQTGKKDMV